MRLVRGRSARRAERPGVDRGQAVIELALALPLVALLLLGVAQVMAVAVHRMAVVHAARDAVRAASVSADPAIAARLAAARTLSDATVTVTLAGPAAAGEGTVTVAVVSRDDTEVPLIGAVIPPVELEARATMALEPP